MILDLEQMDYSIASSPNLDFSSYDSLRRIEMKNGTSIDGRAIDFMLGLQQDLVLENIRDADIDNDALNDGGIRVNQTPEASSLILNFNSVSPNRSVPKKKFNS